MVTSQGSSPGHVLPAEPLGVVPISQPEPGGFHPGFFLNTRRVHRQNSENLLGLNTVTNSASRLLLCQPGQ